MGTFHVIKDGIVYELREEPEGGFTISVPALPGCLSFGDTIEDALSMIAEATTLWLEVAREEGFAIPSQFELR
ncbi:MAG: type II toxin-antitoxin system HicB family antitoxin, partial [Dehalococcoidia bacterium]